LDGDQFDNIVICTEGKKVSVFSTSLLCKCTLTAALEKTGMPMFTSVQFSYNVAGKSIIFCWWRAQTWELHMDL